MPELPTLPPIAAAPLSVVLTAGTGAPVEEYVARWTAYLETLGREFEVILVEGPDRDGYASLADAAERFPQLRALCLVEPHGEGTELAAGLAAARLPLVFYCLCEPAYRPEDLGKLLAEIDKVHLISGFRVAGRTPLTVRLARLFYVVFCTIVFSHRPAPSPGWPGWKRLFGRWLVRAVFGVHCKDVDCPYRLLRRDILVRIPLQSRGSFVHVELLAKANFLGQLIAEEIPLNDGQPSSSSTEPRRERVRDVLADARRVFSHPDFGPVELPEAAMPAAREPEPPPELAADPSP
jgi:hypothetical protein